MKISDKLFNLPQNLQELTLCNSFWNAWLVQFGAQLHRQTGHTFDEQQVDLPYDHNFILWHCDHS